MTPQQPPPETARPHVVLGVGGGIAAYKVCELLRRLTESGHDVTVVPTSAALQFVGRATWEALSGRPVRTDVFTDVAEVPHVSIGRSADLVVVAPATADLLARAAHGLADDLLTNTLLTARCPMLFAPAMHTEMWEHPATRENVRTLRRRGCIVLDPAVGRLTGVDSGAGRLPEPAQLFDAATAVLHRSRARQAPDLGGRRVVVSAGGTREYIDPVRFLSNRSSGRQGYALAAAAAARGAEVTVVAANVSLPEPAGTSVVRVETTGEMREAVHAAAVEADVVVMAAAPSDFRPSEPSSTKIKKSLSGAAAAIELVQNPDILAELVTRRTGKQPVVVGFAAETGDEEHSVLEHARAKLVRKGCDLLVVNDVSGGKVFGQDETEAVILGVDGSVDEVAAATKDVLADRVWDAVTRLLPETGPADAAGSPGSHPVG